VISGFVNDHGNASLKRSTLLGKSSDGLLCKSGVGKLRPAGSIFCGPRGSHTYIVHIFRVYVKVILSIGILDFNLSVYYSNVNVK